MKEDSKSNLGKRGDFTSESITKWIQVRYQDMDTKVTYGDKMPIVYYAGSTVISKIIFRTATALDFNNRPAYIKQTLN